MDNTLKIGMAAPRLPQIDPVTYSALNTLTLFVGDPQSVAIRGYPVLQFRTSAFASRISGDLSLKGLTSRQTAEELGTSARTVESQRESIKRKLRVDSLTQAAVAFVLSTSGLPPTQVVETLKYFCGIARIMETLMMRSGTEYHEPADRTFA